MPQATVLNITKPATPANPTTGQTLIAMVRDLICAHARADADGGPSRNARMNAAWHGTFDVARATAFIPIESCIEALAQIIFLSDELEDVLSNFVDEDEHQTPALQSAIQALRARPVLLASWMEREFGIDRKQWSLEFFASDAGGRAKYLPHLAG